ncbi:hypothetical protein TCON_0296 [Astathelohania contejeani]|uniref:Uncharacterized protein n=1 Tax=Astathelohania contejeani TaxID=164912 RepID=A0ABQ7I243_9MICR|nr:hypothetical protein TCON_0296 [Thelohania contejeani]
MLLIILVIKSLIYAKQSKEKEESEFNDNKQMGSIYSLSTQIDSVIQIGFTNNLDEKYVLDPETLMFVQPIGTNNYFMNLQFNISKEKGVEIFRIICNDQVLCVNRKKTKLEWGDKSRYDEDECGFVFQLYSNNLRKMQSAGGGFVTWDTAIPSIKKEEDINSDTFFYDILVLPSPKALKECLDLINDYESKIGEKRKKSDGGGLTASFSRKPKTKQDKKTDKPGKKLKKGDEKTDEENEEEDDKKRSNEKKDEEAENEEDETPKDNSEERDDEDKGEEDQKEENEEEKQNSNSLKPKKKNKKPQKNKKNKTSSSKKSKIPVLPGFIGSTLKAAANANPITSLAGGLIQNLANSG